LLALTHKLNSDQDAKFVADPFNNYATLTVSLRQNTGQTKIKCSQLSEQEYVANSLYLLG